MPIRIYGETPNQLGDIFTDQQQSGLFKQYVVATYDVPSDKERIYASNSAEIYDDTLAEAGVDPVQTSLSSTEPAHPQPSRRQTPETAKH